MNHVSFFKYHNRLIKFKYDDQWIEGVVIDDIPYSEKRRSTDYVFIHRDDIQEWREAYIRKDNRAKRNLQRTVDIAKISKAELLELHRV